MYTITEEKIIIENVEATVYGISCDEIRIDDISTDKKAVEHLVDLCNEGELAPYQLMDVVEDMLG